MAKSNISYGFDVRWRYAKTNLEIIEKAQRRILRIIFFKKRCDSLQSIYERCNIFTSFMKRIETYVVEFVRDLVRQFHGSHRSISDPVDTFQQIRSTEHSEKMIGL